MSAYIDQFTDNESIIKKYAAPKDALDGANVLLAWYSCGSYSGCSLVVFEREGKLYEVNGFHCSIDGLEGQWEPEETTWAALEIRNVGIAYDGEAEAREELKKACRRTLESRQNG